MNSVFIAQDNEIKQGIANSRNPYVVLESIDVSTRIFSYHMADFEGLYGFLAQKFADSADSMINNMNKSKSAGFVQ